MSLQKGVSLVCIIAYRFNMGRYKPGLIRLREKVDLFLDGFSGLRCDYNI
jgi:hypothetical protein